ncbi:unnamed protein product [Urochloa humidicola]
MRPIEACLLQGIAFPVFVKSRRVSICDQMHWWSRGYWRQHSHAANCSLCLAAAFFKLAQPVLVPRAASRVVSLSMCTEVCAIIFAVGAVVVFTLK